MNAVTTPAAAAQTPAPKQPLQQQPQGPRKLSDEMTELRPELEKVLPAHISVDKFMRVVNTAISQNPDLYRADRRSLFTACVKCATDGLVPDGREAALVIYNTKEKYTDDKNHKQERWIQKVQYMPMVFGILKKIRNSGELASLTCNVVLEQDEFRYWIDDVGEHILHEPNLKVPSRGQLLCTYVIAKTKDGGVYTEVMTRDQIDKIRSVSKSKDKGPWVDWYDEMARKSVIRRLSKRLPMSTDIVQVIQRDDELVDLRQARREGNTSGVDTAKQFLGISEPSGLLEGPESESSDEGSGEIEAGQPLPATWATTLRGATSVAEIDEMKVRCSSAFGGELPQECHAAYEEMREVLGEREGRDL